MDPWNNSRKGHNNRSYTIHITKTGLLITRNSRHVKQTQITTEQYLWDLLDTHKVTDALDDILKQIENQTSVNKFTLTMINVPTSTQKTV